jgi:PAS domain S-box-containing protein
MPKPISFKQRARKRSRPIAAMVAGVFLLAGLVWTFATDVALYQLVEDRVLIARFETAKDWLFVAVGALALYLITHSATHGLARSDALNAAILNSISDGVFVVGADRKITIANPAAGRILGVERPQSLVGMGPEEFVRRFHVTNAKGEVVTPLRLVSQRALSGERPPPYKAHLHPRHHHEVVIIATGAPVRATDTGPVEASVSVMHDITVLEQLEHVRDQFFASAAHAIKTPIAVLKAQLHILDSTSDIPHRALAIMDRQCGRLDRLADGILALVRIQSGTLRLHPTRVDIAQIVTDVGREMALASAHHPLDTKTLARPIVFGDPERIAQVLRSMLDVAYRRARPNTQVHFALAETDGHAEVSIEYVPYAPEHARGAEDGAGYTGLDVESRVVKALVEATGGRVRSKLDAEQRTDLVELPTSSEGDIA